MTMGQVYINRSVEKNVCFSHTHPEVTLQKQKMTKFSTNGDENAGYLKKNEIDTYLTVIISRIAKINSICMKSINVIKPQNSQNIIQKIIFMATRQKINLLIIKNQVDKNDYIKVKTPVH